MKSPNSVRLRVRSRSRDKCRAEITDQRYVLGGVQFIRKQIHTWLSVEKKTVQRPQIEDTFWGVFNLYESKYVFD